MIAARLETGEAAELTSVEGEGALLVAPRAYAPGAPLRLDALLADGELPLEAKCLGSKRRPDGRFDVRIRWINLRRTDRERLAGQLGDGD
jgi:hypothetical protein